MLQVLWLVLMHTSAQSLPCSECGIFGRIRMTLSAINTNLVTPPNSTFPFFFCTIHNPTFARRLLYNLVRLLPSAICTRVPSISSTARQNRTITSPTNFGAFAAESRASTQSESRLRSGSRHRSWSARNSPTKLARFAPSGALCCYQEGHCDWKRIVATRVTIALLALLFGPALGATFA
jgi:hypothetical protein